MNTSLQNNITVETTETNDTFAMQPNEEYIAEIKRIINENSNYPSVIKAKKNSHLVLKFGKDDVVRQFKDKERYPFRCDFYIKSLDLFIEYNGSWTHGTHSYDPNSEEDQEQVAEWVEKDKARRQKTGKKTMYEIAAYVWTELDPRKVNYAISNHLHYIVFWTESEAMSWLSGLPSHIIQEQSHDNTHPTSN